MAHQESGGENKKRRREEEEWKKRRRRLIIVVKIINNKLNNIIVRKTNYLNENKYFLESVDYFIFYEAKYYLLIYKFPR